MRKDTQPTMTGWVYLALGDRVVVVYVNSKGIRGVTYQFVNP